MNRHERAIVVILRFVGICGLFALPAAFLPNSWMAAIHEAAGLGKMPLAPVVEYLARSLSVFYALFSAFTLLIACDIRRYRPFVKLWGWMAIAFGVLITGIDMAAGLPTWWTWLEGPPTIVAGAVMLWLERSIAEPASPA